MKRVATHLLAGILGWWAMGSWTRHAPVEAELANKDRSGTPPVTVRSTGSPSNIRQRFLNEWEKRVGEPVASGADLEVKRSRLELLFMEWLQVDPVSALAHFDEQVLPGQHNTIRNALGTANPADAELIFREVDRVESVAFYKFRYGLDQLAHRVAKSDPKRGVALVLSRPAGTMRGDIVAGMLQGQDEAVFKQLRDLIAAESAFFRSPNEARIIQKKIAEEERRFRTGPANQ